jgi:hypothetical protein
MRRVTLWRMIVCGCGYCRLAECMQVSGLAQNQAVLRNQARQSVCVLPSAAPAACASTPDATVLVDELTACLPAALNGPRLHVSSGFCVRRAL